MEINQKVLDKVIERIPKNAILALGNGKGTNHIINALDKAKGKIDSIVCSAGWTMRKIRQLGFVALDPNDTNQIDIYIDTASEVTEYCNVNKGVDLEILRHKFFAQFAKEYICCVSATSVVKIMGEFPILVETLPCARSFVSRKLTSRKLINHWTSDFETENGNPFLLIENAEVFEPQKFENSIEKIPGVLACSIVSRHAPDTIFVSRGSDVQVIQKNNSTRRGDHSAKIRNKWQTKIGHA